MFDLITRILPIFLIIGVGVFLRRRRMVDAAFNRVLAVVLVNVFFPALIFSSLARQFSLSAIRHHALLPVGCFLLLFFGGAVGWGVTRLHPITPAATSHVFKFQCSVNNYSFLPLMIAAVLWGEQALAMVVFATLGAELFVWTLGIQIMTGQPVRRRNLRRLISMPMLAMICAFAYILLRDGLFRVAHIPSAQAAQPGPIARTLIDTFRILGQATIPVSALIAGSRMAGLHPAHLLSRTMAILVGLRLVVIPAAAIGIARLLPIPPDIFQVLAIIALMPCALTSVTLAEIFHADADFAAASILATHVVAIVTIPIGLRLLSIA